MTTATPPWVDAARSVLGTHEIAGAQDNPFVVSCLAGVGLPHQHDETAWCAAFVQWALKQTGVAGTGRANARSYLTWGVALDAPKLGAVCVFSRPPDPAHGHVAFYMGEHDGMVSVLGGNQRNAVCVADYPRSRLIAMRWPV